MHQAVPINKQSVSNGCIAVTFRCCDDPTTDSISTLHLSPGVDVNAWAAQEKLRVESEHQAMQDAHAALAAFTVQAVHVAALSK